MKRPSTKSKHVLRIISGKRNIRIVAIFIFISFFLIKGKSFAQNGEAIYKQNCTACHTIGGGRLVGPDLKGLNAKRSETWILKFVKSSQSFIKSGDTDAKAIFDEYNGIVMPDQNISDTDIKSIIAYIASQSPAEPEITEIPDQQETTEPEKPAKTTAEATQEEITAGRELFSGKKRFANGGASCLSCHNVSNDSLMGGGSYAKDLTTAYSRLTEAGITGILNAPPFPAMTQAYKDNPITPDEIFQITAFLNRADSERIYQNASSSDAIFIYGGGFGIATLLCLIYFIWFKRKKQSVKHSIYTRQIKSI